MLSKLHRKDYPAHEEGLRELNLFRQEKRKLQDDLIVACQYLKRAKKKDGEGLFMRACSDRVRVSGSKLKENKFRLDPKKKLFTLGMVRHWNRLTREALDAPSLEVFKARLDGALSNLV
ncbi:hypothetical protein WISP_52549 [Willisornis vidua]|uniref:Uncharacterized protein n=1 Tax=Willisornis vidua TaxID=1566151 RepID=A0ABQ9DDW9_9PASS|nr:hypothetical protein WISP_52549 [Willisornis vidua]